jgi:hypothetical protein
MVYLRFHHKGHYFKEPRDYHDAPIRKVNELHQKHTLIDGRTRRGNTIDLVRFEVFTAVTMKNGDTILHNRSWLSQKKGWTNPGPILIYIYTLYTHIYIDTSNKRTAQK